MTGTDPWQAARDRMVEMQIAARGIKDERVLSAMRSVPRHIFVPEEARAAAYGDYPLPIGHGQTISQPYIVAMMTSLLEIRPQDRVLEIGAGSGYQAAILGRLAQEVISIERIPEVAHLAEKNLATAGIMGVRVIVGDGTLGYPDLAPYDAVLITAATPSVPSPLIDQLAEGGRLVAPVGSRDLQELVRLTRKGSELSREFFGGVVFVPLLGEHGWEH
ncbi:MAG: protein-L-isoaspartate(D-aspartate) O-methyltransferase [Methanoregulaceae archaeon]|jgi:protein-L-isoaspartate(D-aspartate) O-methyltransferase|nr:protein-L-isoaspartate(D-aspartate) O-methyltransferase [Methanoregulaceae archaeon]MCU0629190.1 protein-L-isoaspartate(D-aspartate) O-methyltransferase [Methanoregulaceae archaeon]